MDIEDMEKYIQDYEYQQYDPIKNNNYVFIICGLVIVFLISIFLERKTKHLLPIYRESINL